MPSLHDFEIRTMPHLWQHYQDAPRQLAFRAETRSAAEVWQATLRAKLLELLGGLPASAPDLDIHSLETVSDDGFEREQIVYQTQPGEYSPCYILRPHRLNGVSRPVIALHGHGLAGARPLVGLAETELERESLEANNYDYARKLALRGYTVFVPTLRGFAERLEAPPHAETANPLWPSSCRSLSVAAMLQGKTLLGLRVWDVMRLLDLIQADPAFAQARIGCVGLSGGGMLSLFAAALDTRIACTVVSGYFNTFRDSIMAVQHCLCNYVPNILTYAEMADIAGLVAPRPLLIVSGTEDPIFPLEGTRRGLAALQPIYQRFEAEQALDSDLFEGGHRWHDGKAYDWLDRWL
jgi:dienelactone hydrolase